MLLCARPGAMAIALTVVVTETPIEHGLEQDGDDVVGVAPFVV